MNERRDDEGYDDFDADYEVEPRKNNTVLIVVIVVACVFGLFLVGGTLMALLGPTVYEAMNDGKPHAAQAQMSNMAIAIDNYRMRHKRLPSTLQELTETDGRNPHPFLRSLPDDPWGQPYDYRVLEPRSYEIRSYGPDGEPQTDDDIVWPEK